MSATVTPSPAIAADRAARPTGQPSSGPPTWGTYRDREGRDRALIARPGVGGSVLVIDQDADTLTDRRLVAHLAADEPAVNAQVVAELYLADDEGRVARALHDRDWVTLPDGRELPEEPEPPAPGELRDARGRRYRLAAVDAPPPRPPDALGAPQRSPARRAGGAAHGHRRPGGLRARPRADPRRAAAGRPPARAPRCWPASCGCSNAARWCSTARCAKHVHRRVRSGELSLSCIAGRCGRGKRRATGLRIGDTTWLQRRLGVLPENGCSEPTPWIHTDVLALIARDGLGVEPREVELA